MWFTGIIHRAFAAAVVLFLIVAYGSSPVVRPDGVVWVLESMHGKPPIENTFITLEVNADRFSGTAGCNRYGGRSESGSRIAGGGGAFSISLLQQTVMDCPGRIGDQEDAYVKALWRAKRFRVIGDRLQILDTTRDVTLVFVKQETLPGNPVELAGTQWRLLPEGDWEADAPAATLIFLDEYRASGMTGCRDYLATYRIPEGHIGFPTVLIVGAYPSCSDEARRLEDRFTTSLSQASDYSVDEDAGSSRLIIRTSRGRTLTFEPLLPAEGSIADGDWVLKAFVKLREADPGTRMMQVINLRPGPEVTMSFGEGGISGSAGCNSYEARYSVDDQVIAFDSPVATERACADLEGVIQQEARFLDLLPSLTRFRIHSDRLFIYAEDGRVVLFAAE